jgi:hypothetical protein
MTQWEESLALLYWRLSGSGQHRSR